jgi:hypothetical protein
MEITKPHCLLAYRWLAAWMHLVYFLSDRNPALQPYHETFSKALEDVHHLVECIRHFYDYFVSHESIDAVVKRERGRLFPMYGGILPLGLLVQSLSERDHEIFRTLTIDVYLSVVDAVVADEAGISLTPEETYWLTHLTKE